MARAQGGTLIEALTTLAVAAILASLAVPSFNNLRHDSERAAALNELFHAIYLARTESVRRAQIVSICKSTDGDTCASPTATAWNDGWIVFVDEDRDHHPQRDPNEPLLLANRGWPAGTITSNRTSFSFRPYQQGVVNGTIVFCDSRGSAHARAIIISHTGRPRVGSRDASNKPLPCP